MQLYDLNILSGGTSEKVAVGMALALQATGGQALSELTSTTLGLVESAAGTLLNSPEALAARITEEMMTLLQDNGTLDAINVGINATQNLVVLAKQALELIKVGSNISANIIALTDADYTFTPSVKESFNLLGKSLYQILLSAYFSAKLMIMDLYNSMICTSQESVIDNVIASINGILNVTEPLLDPILLKYTGYTITEVRFLCNQGFMLYRMMQRVYKLQKQKKAQKQLEQLIEQETELQSYSLTIDANIDPNWSEEEKQLYLKELAGKRKEAFKEEARKKYREMTQDMNIDDIKLQLSDWVSRLSIILLNAFHILIIKDMIKNISIECLLLQNQGIENLADFLAVFQAFNDFFDMLGLTPNAVGLTTLDLLDLGIATASGMVSTASNVANQITNNANNVILDNILNSLNNAMSGIPSVNLSSQITSEVEKYNLKFEQANSGGIINVTLQLYEDPRNNNYLNDVFRTSFKISGVQIFDNGAKNSILLHCLQSWNYDTLEEFTVQGRVNGLIRYYNFNIKSDKNHIPSINTNLQISLDVQDNSLNLISDFSIQPSKILDGVNADIDTLGIEKILEGKVLMFDPIVLILKMFLPIIEIFKVLVHLLENHKINKQYAEGMSHDSLWQCAGQMASKVKGLADVFNLNDTNFFTVRSGMVDRFCREKLNAIPNEDGFCKINQLSTTALNSFLTLHAINPHLDLLKGTTLYFVSNDILQYDEPDPRYDGTTNGLDIDFVENPNNPDLSAVYYDKCHRSPLTSEIYRAMQSRASAVYKNADSLQFSNMNAILLSLLYESDEFDGLQMIDLLEMKLCDPIEYEDIEIEDIDVQITDDGVKSSEKAKRVIIEFGDEYTLGEAVQFKLNVSPGLAINKNTIIAYVTKDGKTLPLKSRFNSGYVKATKDNDFYRVYPYNTTRHIVLCDTENNMGLTEDIDMDSISSFGEEMGAATENGLFIMNFLVQTTLPIILANAKRTTKDSQTLSTFNSNIENFQKEINDIISENKLDDGNRMQERIKSSIKNNDLTGLGDELQELNSKLIDTAIKHYDKIVKDSYYVNGKLDYMDCLGLAYGDNPDLKGNASSGYFNYYVNMLTAAKDSKNEYIIKFKKLLRDIIDNRCLTESYKIGDLTKEFNDLYEEDFVLTNKKHSDYYSIIDDKFLTMNKEINTEIDELEKTIVAEYVEQLTDANGNLTSVNTLKTLKDSIDIKSTREQKLYQKLYDYILNDIKDKSGNKKKSDNDSEVQKLKPKVQLIANLFLFIKEANNQTTDEKKEYSAEHKMQDLKKYFNTLYKQYIKNADNFSTIYKTFCTSRTKANLKKAIQAINKDFDNDSILTNLYNAINNYYNLDKQVKELDKSGLYILSYELVLEESEKILKFWKDILADKTKYKLDSSIKKFKDFANSLIPDILWPESVGLNIAGIDYNLYEFYNYEMPSNKKMPNFNFDDVNVEDLVSQYQDQAGELPEDWDNTENLLPIRLPEITDYSIMDFEYWLVYMLNATLISLIPLYWGDGFDIPPFMVPVLLPAIFFPIAPPVPLHVLSLNVLFVFGLSFRGLYPAPIILLVNMSDRPINVMLPVMMALDAAKMLLEVPLSILESTIPKIINGTFNDMFSENAEMKKKLDKYRIYSSLIKSIPLEDKALIEQTFMDSLYDEMNKRDKRLVVTREEKLNNGPEPL